MASKAPDREGRLRRRLRLSHVQERSNERLRDRWQRRLDAGEEILCWHCRMGGVSTVIDPQRWHIREDTRAPECPSCHQLDQPVPFRDRAESPLAGCPQPVRNS